ncbi:MAG: hypothetical protein GY794_20090 [bacterium]|nr:hypothetical protein [bacterium]
MKIKQIVLCFATLLVVAGAFQIVLADAETEAFIKEIISGQRTDSDRSAKLMEAVALAEGNQKLKIALLERSVYYGLKSLRSTNDCEALADVLGDLMTSVPEKKSYWLAQRASVYRRWCSLEKSPGPKRRVSAAVVASLTESGCLSASEGDWKTAGNLFTEARKATRAYKLSNPNALLGYIRTSSYMHKVVGKIATYTATIKKSPDDLKARVALVKLLVTVIDDPGKAEKYINEDVDEKYQMFVPMASKGISALSPDACKNLGDWYYKELSKSLVGVVKSRMLARAKICYEHVLNSQTKVDVTSAVLKLNLSKIKAAQSKLGKVDPGLCWRCYGNGKKSCGDCMVNGRSIGLEKCIGCRGFGRVKCSSCNGAWRLKCSKCFGRGKVVTGTKTSNGLSYKVYGKCGTCRGSGVTHRVGSSSESSGVCRSCGTQNPESFRGTSACGKCYGKGGSGTCGTCNGEKTLTCEH